MPNRNIPFIGWSVAAQNFRRVVEERAAKPISVLIVGEAGVGKHLMASVWQAISRAGKDKLPIIELDTGVASLPPRCIAISTRPPAHNRTGPKGRGGSLITLNAPWHLGEDCYAPIPPGECETDPLPDSVSSRFSLKLYMPPLQSRLIDILAVLHALAEHAPAADRGFVSSSLIHRLFWHSRWVGNVAQLIDYLRARIADVSVAEGADAEHEGHHAPGGRQPAAAPATQPTASPEWHLEDETIGQISPDGTGPMQGTVYGQPFLPALERSGEAFERRDWFCPDRSVPLARLPVVAFSIFLKDFFDQLEVDSTGGTDPNLGRVHLWAGSPDPEDLNTKDDGRPFSTPATPAWSWGKLEQRLADGSPQEFLTEYVFGLPIPSGRLGDLVAGLTSHAAYGATLDSLQAGVGLRLERSYRELYNWFSSIQIPKVPRKKRGRPKKESLTPAEARAYELIHVKEMELFEAAEEMGVTVAELTALLQEVARKSGEPRKRTVGGRFPFDDTRDKKR
ncbi:sigma 54-interacting transcriptional regulator [Gemmata sp. JC717]|uniref:sigma 54-interacting transcriptional regulator n=1 Tax=Gemmata algarum TaxID=2975278 RepID=UPI0021BB67EC|nr:sigma 54-interacting transcriptional regulator [Gemmata algarum]MDY3555979.1 sigma 54-interacting transcriptional regulator [Gemmata algarum]